MKIIIVGCGKVGQKLTEQLSDEGHDITVIDPDREVIDDTASQYDVMGIVGSGADRAVLDDAGIEDTDLLIAVTQSDELNLLCCLIAKKSGNCQTIARVRKPEYIDDIDLVKEELGLAMVINPEHAAAVEIARVFRFPTAIKIDTFAKGKVELMKFRIKPDSILCGMPVMDITAKLKCDVLACAVERGDEAFIPSGTFVLRAEDRVSVIAPPYNAAMFFKKIGLKTGRVHNVIIAGGGDVSYYLAQMLAESNVRVKIIDSDRDRCELLSENLPKAVVIHGDATDRGLLFEEGLEYADGFAALTDVDEENIMLSLFAKIKSNAKRITKINKITFDEVISSMDLDTLIYPKSITAEYIIRFVRALSNSIGSNVETMHRIIENKAEALEFIIRENSSVVGIPLEQLKLKDNLLIACINRDGKVILPRGQDVIAVGDTVIVVTTHLGLGDISDIIAPSRGDAS